MKQHPRLRLRIGLLEVLEESGVGEVLQARGVIRHDVGLSWEETSKVAVAVGSLVVAGVAAEVGRGARA